MEKPDSHTEGRYPLIGLTRQVSPSTSWCQFWMTQVVRYPLPSSPSNKFGHALEFDDQGRIPGYRIDFDAMAEQLYQISMTSRRHGLIIQRVIFDPRLTERLFSSNRHGAELRRIMPFMK